MFGFGKDLIGMTSRESYLKKRSSIPTRVIISKFAYKWLIKVTPRTSRLLGACSIRVSVTRLFCSRVQRSTSRDELWSARVLNEEATDTATTLVTGLLIWICMQTG